jgi:hypothetical protein
MSYFDSVYFEVVIWYWGNGSLDYWIDGVLEFCNAASIR